MKNLLTSLSLLISVFSINFDSKAAIVTAILGGGAWNSPTSWNGGVVPSCGDTIEVPVGSDIIITENVNLDDGGNPLCALVRLNIAGSLRFGNGKKLYLAEGACVNVEAGGIIRPSKTGGGASERIMVGSEEEWRAGDGILNGAVQLGCAVILPLNFVDFSILSDNRNVNFKWKVESEQNIDVYSIEKSTDGENWIKLYQENSIGDHADAHIYEYETAIVTTEKMAYYKLFSTCNNGVKSQLAMKSLNTSENLELNEISIFPNPTESNSILNIYLEEQLNDKVEITIYNQVGTKIKTLEMDKQQNEKLFSIELIDLKAGTYFLNLNDGEQNLKSKFAVL